MRLNIIPIVLLVLTLFMGSVVGWAANSPDKKRLAWFVDETLKANGRKETILNISTFGRYAILVKSPQGSALQLIGRLIGPGVTNGITGEKDGRLDEFLEKGEYKVVVHSHKEGKGEVKLSIHPFKELNGAQPPRLIQYKWVESQLNDFEQRSYWLDIKKRRKIIIEAAGRSLSDLRLWRNGDWLVDAMPQKVILEPHEGKLLDTFRIMADLNPGLYLLTAYGGPPKVWSEESNAQPLYIRMGIPQLPASGRHNYSASPFGLDRFLIPAEADFYQLLLPKSEKADLTVRQYNQNEPFYEYGNRKRITKNSRLPVAEVTTYSKNQQLNLVTVKREAGKPYTLQFFKSVRTYQFSGSGDYWISTLHSGYGEDSVDATALLFERAPRQEEKLIENQVVKINKEKNWRRRFNLLQKLTLFIEIEQKGQYLFEGAGVSARYLVEPFFIRKPDNYERPEFKNSGAAWDLDAGFYVLTVTPKRRSKGVLDLTIQPKKLAFFDKEVKLQNAEIATRFERVKLNDRYAYTLYMNEQPEVKTGVVLRSLPIDLREALPITQKMGESINIKVRIPENGKIAAVTDDGRHLDIWFRGMKIQNRILSPKTYAIQIKNPTADQDARHIHYNLSFMPEGQLSDRPLPPLSAKALSKLPRFQVLDETQPVYLKVDRRETHTFRVMVKKPALYRLETTGLLETEGNLRTRLHSSLARRSKNGVGRNFLIQQFLREGTYQLTTQPMGETRGTMGVHLAHTQLNDGGRLIADTPARYGLIPGNGLIYRFHIDQPGKYRYRALGLSQKFLIRLEDADGWPIIKPNQPADVTLQFDSGDYQVIVLPKTVNARVVSLLEYIPPDVVFEGHGPHYLTPPQLDHEIRHRWMEPEPGAARTPDQWCFSVPATLEAHIRMSPEMQGRLQLVDESRDGLAIKEPVIIEGNKTWSQELSAGSYRLSVQSRKPNNRLDYRVKIQFTQLVDGFSRNLSLPMTIPVSVGENRIYEFSSFGVTDVRAELYDDTQQLITRADDQNNDWNFTLAKRLRPGYYHLRLEPVGSESALTTISMKAPDAVLRRKLNVPISFTTDDNRLQRYSLSIPKGPELLLITAGSRDDVSIALEENRNGFWHSAGRAVGKKAFLGLMLDRETDHHDYQLVVQSIARRKEPVKIKVIAINPDWRSEQDLTDDGVPFEVLNGDVPVGVAAVKLDSKGFFRIDTSASPSFLIWSHLSRKIFEAPEKGQIVGDQVNLCFLTDLKNPKALVKCERVRLNDKKRLQMNIPAGRRAMLDIDSHSDYSSEGSDDNLFLLWAESRTGQPGIAFAKKEQTDFMPASVGVKKHSAVTVNIGTPADSLTLWNAEQEKQPLSLYIQKTTFSFSVNYVLKTGILDIELKAAAAAKCALVSGLKRIQLNLPPYTAAVLTKDRRILAVHWSGADFFSQQTDTQAEQILLLHIGEHSTRVNLTSIPIDGDQALTQIAPGMLVRRHFATQGHFTFNVAEGSSNSSSGLFLNLYGAGAEALAVEKNGRMQRGTRIAISDGALIDISHQPGLVMAWLESGRSDPRRIGSQDSAEKTVIDAGRSIALTGPSNTFQFENWKPVMLHLKTDTPVISKFISEGLPQVILVFPKGASQNIFLPVKETNITLLPCSSGNLSGTAEFLFSDVVPLKEGLGPKMILAPGSARLFRFSLDHDGPVGVGVRGSADIATCTLMDGRGAEIGKGVIIMHTLNRGDYFFKVAIPPNASPVEIQPVVVGIELPGSGPPREVIQKYLQMAGLKTEN